MQKGRASGSRCSVSSGRIAGRKKYPAAIISYGYTETSTEVSDFCRDFAQMGYMAFCITVLTEVADLLTVKEYVLKLPYIDNSNLILLGFSQGGVVSGLVAAKCGNEISKLIMVFPALCISGYERRDCQSEGSN